VIRVGEQRSQRAVPLRNDEDVGVDTRVDDYLASLAEPQRTVLAELRQTITELVPEAQECISYGLPAYQLDGTTIAGFAAFKNHLSYLPHSGSVLDVLGDELGDFQGTKGSLHFSTGRPLPRRLVARLLDTRMAEAGLSPQRGDREEEAPSA
jgi:uncharacterized protein YdhG (YjbR/CyaY superfamily)